MRPENKTKSIFVVILLMLLLTVVVALFLVYLSFKNQEDEFLPKESREIIEDSLQSNLGVVVTESVDGEQITYEIRGRLTEKGLYYTNNILMGDFIIEGDTSQTVFNLLLGAKSGEMVYAEQIGEIITFETVPTETVYQNSSNNRNIFFRISINYSNDPETLEDEFIQSINKQAEMLERLVEGGVEAIEPYQTFRPIEFGIIL